MNTTGFLWQEPLANTQLIKVFICMHALKGKATAEKQECICDISKPGERTIPGLLLTSLFNPVILLLTFHAIMFLSGIEPLDLIK